MSWMPLHGARVHRYVGASCPTCHADSPDRPLEDVHRLFGWLVVRDGHVWLERGCLDHGLVRTLYDESPEILSYLEEWTLFCAVLAWAPLTRSRISTGTGSRPSLEVPFS